MAEQTTPFTYPEALDYLSDFEQSTIKLGLQRIETLLKQLGDPQLRFPAVHIAGTNGKGSVAAFLDTLLAGDNRLVGRYVSPHLISPRERILIDGLPITRPWFSAVMSYLRDQIDTVSVRPSYFEAITAAAFYAFRFLEVDWAVVETGLGGRLDATNTLHPELTVITEISADHTQMLGNSTASIAREKAGILKPGVPVVTWRDVDAYPIIETVAKKVSVPVIALGRGDVTISEDRHPRVRVRLGNVELSALSPLAGSHQGKNLALALTAFHQLTGVTGDLSDRLTDMDWPCRLETLPTTPPVTLDGAHNLNGIAAFLNAVEPVDPDALLVFGCMRDKVAAEMYAQLHPRFSRRILTAGGYHRFMQEADFRDHPGFADPFVPIEEVTGQFRDASHVFVCGSLHLLGDVIREMSRKPAYREVLLEKKPYSHLLDADPA